MSVFTDTLRGQSGWGLSPILGPFLEDGSLGWEGDGVQHLGFLRLWMQQGIDLFHLGF